MSGYVETVERTLLLIKPDGVQRGLVGNILQRVEAAGLAIVGVAMRWPTEEFARGHYADDAHQLRQMGQKLLAGASGLGFSVAEKFGTDDPIELGRLIFELNVKYLTSGPVVVAVVQGFNAVHKTRQLCGSTMPRDAAPGTIRGDFSSVGAEQVIHSRATVRNLVHASDSSHDPREPEREIAYWFSKDELFDHPSPHWAMLT